MRDVLRKYRGVIVVFSVLLLSVLFLYVSAQGREDSGRLTQVVHWVTGPVQESVTRLWHAGASRWSRYVWLMETMDQNERLQDEVEAQRVEIALLEEQRRENQRLRRLLDLERAVPTARHRAAQIIAVGQSASFKILRINRGIADGVRRRAGVVATDGVVGRVIAASTRYADVLLITDAGSRLDIMAERSRARGVLRGGGEAGRCVIEAMDRTMDLERGDMLITSGLDGIFPKGIPVGRVTEVVRPTMGLYLEAAVEPYVSFSTLEEVMVYISPPESLRWPQLHGEAVPAAAADEAGLDAGSPEDGGP